MTELGVTATAAVVGALTGGIAMAVGSDARPARPGLVAAATALGAVAVGLVASAPTVALAGPLVAVLTLAEVRRAADRRAESQCRAGVPVVVDQMIQQLRSGASLRAVCEAASPASSAAGSALEPLAAALRAGRPLAEAVARLRESAAEGDRFDVLLVATTLAALVDRGSPAVPALQRLRVTLMGAVEARARARVQAGQAQASTALLAGAPALFALVIGVADAEVGHLYLRETVGTGCVVAALVCSYGGWRWMSRLVDQVLTEERSR